MVDWDKVREKLEPCLRENRPPRELETLDEVKAEYHRVISHLENVIEEVVPLSKPIPICNRWWTRELMAL